MMPHLGGRSTPGYRPGSRTVFDGGVIWAFLAFTALAAVLALLALAPVRKEPFAVVTFLGAWVVGEVPVHAAVVVVAGTATLGGTSPRGVPRGGSRSCSASGRRSGTSCSPCRPTASAGLVDRALDTAAGGPLDAGGVDLAPAWLSWWRLVIAIPFRFGRIRRIRNIDYEGDGLYRHRLDVLVRRADPPSGAPVLVYIHGGAWVIGDKREQGLPMLHELVQRGWVCVAINYRLSPKATWPDHIIDCKRALAWVRAHIHEYGGDPSFVALSGGSAGGHLSALAALTPHDTEWQPGFEDADTSVDACVPFYGVHDMTGSPEAEGAHGHGLIELLEKRVMKLPYVDNTPVYDQASPDQRITPERPGVPRGPGGQRHPGARPRSADASPPAWRRPRPHRSRTSSCPSPSTRSTSSYRSGRATRRSAWSASSRGSGPGRRRVGGTGPGHAERPGDGGRAGRRAGPVRPATRGCEPGGVLDTGQSF